MCYESTFGFLDLPRSCSCTSYCFRGSVFQVLPRCLVLSRLTKHVSTFLFRSLRLSGYLTFAPLAFQCKPGVPRTSCRGRASVDRLHPQGAGACVTLTDTRTRNTAITHCTNSSKPVLTFPTLIQHSNDVINAL